MLMSLDDKTVTFYKNGELKHTFDGIPATSLRPIISFGGTG